MGLHVAVVYLPVSGSVLAARAGDRLAPGSPALAQRLHPRCTGPTGSGPGPPDSMAGSLRTGAARAAPRAPSPCTPHGGGPASAAVCAVYAVWKVVPAAEEGAGGVTAAAGWGGS